MCTLLIYVDEKRQIKRLQMVLEAFRDGFGGETPKTFATAPGRVNLIGEHIDYEGYGVLPMAIVLDTVVAIRKNPESSVITLKNTNSSVYGALTFPTSPDQEIDTNKHSWGNYVIAAYKGVFNHLRKHHPESEPEPVGLDIMVDGRVPTESGLSSSAAIVCSSALAIMDALGVPRLPKTEVAEFTALAERYVGVISGGMDQAISIMAKEGVAQLIEFNPVRGAPVNIPSDAVFVIGNSMTVSNKAESATGRYNLRVVECRLATAVMAKAMGASKEDILSQYKTLKSIEPLIESWYSSKSIENNISDPNWCVAAVFDFLPEGSCTRKMIEDTLGYGITELFDKEDNATNKVLSTFDTFKLHPRALHVYKEKQRVYDFAQICADSRCNSDTTIKLLGSLMDMSHDSCAKLYECSSPELDQLVAIAKENGALGSRLTGAGWGGCTVSLVRKDMVEEFMKKIKLQYYDALIEKGIVNEDSMDVTLFSSKPGSGAGVYLSAWMDYL